MSTLYESVGGMPFFESLVERFYAEVEHNAGLRALYPSDLTASRDSLALFLAQYFGGPTTYSDVKGHPRLRMRHAHLPIDVAARDGWYDAMVSALDQVDLDSEARVVMRDYFDRSATWMINV